MLRLSNAQIPIVIIIAVILFFCVNLIANNLFKNYEIDLTQDSIFALTPSTKEIISQIDEPITFRFFYTPSASNGLPLVKNYASRIQDLLGRYVKSSSGQIKLEIIDPKLFSQKEDLAIGYGIKSIDVNNNKLYLGLAITNTRDDSRIIPFFHPQRQRFVEYEITKALYDLLQQRRPVIGLITTLKMHSGPFMGIQALGGGSSWLVLEQLKQGFDIVNIDPEQSAIPDNIDLLMIVQPRALNLALLSSIDQYVLAGGKTMIFADPYQEGVSTGVKGDRSFSGEFNNLLKAWGVQIAPNKVVVDKNAARPVSSNAAKDGKVDYIAWLNIGPEGLNQEEVTTASLKNINFATAGHIIDLKNNDIKIIPLVQTSKMSKEVDVSQVRGTPDPNKLLSNFVPANKKYILAARIEGNVRSAFVNDPPRTGRLNQSLQPINVILVADTDLLRDHSWAQIQDMQGYKVIMQNGDNSSFVSNIAELLSGSSKLIALRGRGFGTRPFTVVNNIRQKAQEKYLQKEKLLKEELAQTESRLEQLKLQAKAQAGNALMYRAKQQKEIFAFSDKMEKIRKELRFVQFSLQKDVDRLGSIVKFINIALIPLIITFFAIFVFLLRKNTKK